MAETIQSTSPRARAVLMAFGPDRPGLLDEISAFLMERGGKIEDIRVAGLGGYFTVLARIVGPRDSLEKVRAETLRLSTDSKIQVEVLPYREEPGSSHDNFPFRFTARGKGQATTMQRISHLMRVLNINIEDVKTHITGPAPETGPAAFDLELLLSVPRAIPVTMLRDYLQHLCAESQVEWQLNPA